MVGYIHLVKSGKSFLRPIAFRHGLSITLEAVPEGLTVDHNATLTATVVDYDGDPIGGKAVTFSVVSGDGTVMPVMVVIIAVYLVMLAAKAKARHWTG